MNHPAIEINYSPATEIKTRYLVLKKQKPEIRARDAAKELGVSEADLVASRVGDGVTKLSDNPEAILQDIKNLGEVMALTRNEYCVSERNGVYANDQFMTHGKMRQGLFVGADIDLRLFMDHWKYCFAVSEGEEKNLRHSIQFFDKAGVALHKIYLKPQSNFNAYEELVKKHQHQEQIDFIEITQYPDLQIRQEDASIDWNGFRNAWENLQDTHDFFPMLRKFKAQRHQALEKIGDDFAYKTSNDSARKILQLASKEKCEIMVFVGNKGAIQIHTGPVNKLVEHGSWFNVLDPKFNLHLREDKIFTSWVTKKPTADGIVTALEIFDEDQELIVTFFGKRKPGIPELELWRQIIEQL